MAARSRKSNSAKKSKRSKAQRAADSGEHARQLAPASAVKSFINEVIATKNATSEEGQRLSTATKRATEAGVNVPAARIAARILSKAKQDSIKARVLWEDTVYYLLECTEFNRIAPTGMFSAEEGGQKRSRKGKQQEMPLEEVEQPPAEQARDPIDEVGQSPVVTH
jgi:hypothetical protein